MTTDEKIENMKAIVNGTMRRKLYFNPAYFEPHLLVVSRVFSTACLNLIFSFIPALSQSPPPGALEFLSKIREVITIAKYKMATKRFQPSLIVIPEEQQINLNEAGLKSVAEEGQENSVISTKDSDANKKPCAGCPGCSSDKPQTSNAGCKNCGEKRNSIRKWLEGVSKHEGEHVLSDHETDPSATKKLNSAEDGVQSESDIDSMRKPPCGRELANKLSDSSSSSDSDTVKANSLGSKSSSSASKKKIPPPLPSTAPKIISHCLKREAPSKTPDKPIPSKCSNSCNGNNKSVPMKICSNNLAHVKSNTPSSPPAVSDIYNNLSIPGSEIYNNPQFMLNSPPQSLRSRNSKQSRSSRSSRKRMEVLDQYANPMLLRQSEAMRNVQKAPDMVYEALANDYTQRKVCLAPNGPYGQINRMVPTPDYDDPNSTLSSMKQRYANVFEDRFQVPTPDYNTPVRNKNGKIYQPDSPIYHRRSPHYLIVDYETDSLERSHIGKGNRNSATPNSNNSSDVGSQPSPSLSAALPLEEEVEVRNTVYDRVEGFRKDGDPARSLNRMPPSNTSIYEEVRSMSSLREPRIRYNTPYHGSMTIEVEHSPTDTEMSTDSDQFEPDTLDRKPKKMNNNLPPPPPNGKHNCTSIPNNQRNTNAWNNHLQKSADFLNHIDGSTHYSSLENMTSLPDMKLLNDNNGEQQQVVLRSSGSFKSNSLGTYFSEIGAIINNTNLDKNFCSLREIYEAKNQKNLQHRPSLTEVDSEEKGRLLTLEARHSRRQRQITLEKKKKPLPPDVIPLKGIVEKVPSNEATAAKSKNLTGWNTDEANDKMCNNNKLNYEQFLPSDSTSNSSNSESTDVTGVSDTHHNSEHDSMRRPYSQVNKRYQLSKLTPEPNDSSDNNFTNSSDIRSSSSQQEHSDCNSESSTIKSSSTKFYYKTNLYQHAKTNALKQIDDDTDKIEILSSKSIGRNDDRPVLMGESATDLMKELANDTTSFSPNLSLAPTKVFRVDVNTATNGMQIALGLKDRVKKSKDLKNAWKKFVNMATSKFHRTDSKSDMDIGSSLSDGVDRDDGIASLNACDENGNMCSSSSTSNLAQILSRTPSSSSSDMPNRSSRNEMDYGYISADSNESRANNKKLYERFNFKANKAISSSNSSCSDSNDHPGDSSQRNMIRMQEIKEISESERSSLPSIKDEAKKIAKNKRDAPKLVDFIPKNIMMHVNEAVDVNVYSSSDDERYSSGMSSDEDGHLDMDEMCESGAESVETHSVFFKKIRKVPNEN